VLAAGPLAVEAADVPTRGGAELAALAPGVDAACAAKGCEEGGSDAIDVGFGGGGTAEGWARPEMECATAKKIKPAFTPNGRYRLLVWACLMSRTCRDDFMGTSPRADPARFCSSPRAVSTVGVLRGCFHDGHGRLKGSDAVVHVTAVPRSTARGQTAALSSNRASVRLRV